MTVNSSSSCGEKSNQMERVDTDNNPEEHPYLHHHLHRAKPTGSPASILHPSSRPFPSSPRFTNSPWSLSPDESSRSNSLPSSFTGSQAAMEAATKEAQSQAVLVLASRASPQPSFPFPSPPTRTTITSGWLQWRVDRDLQGCPPPAIPVFAKGQFD